MARNGSGTYSRVSGTPYVNGTVIDEVVVNSEMSDIATALTQSIAKDGQTTPSANLPMGGYIHTGVGAATALTHYTRADQAQNSSLSYLSSVSGADTITASATPTPAAYADGQAFRFISAGANTGAATLNVSSLGAKSIKKQGTTALSAGDIPNGAIVEVAYDGTNFQLTTIRYQDYDVDTAKLDVDQTWTGAQRGTVTTDNDGSFDQAATNNFSCTPTGNVTLTFTNHTAGQSGFILFDNTGAYTGHSLAATTKASSTFLTTINAAGVYLIAYFDNGTNAYVTTTSALA